LKKEINVTEQQAEERKRKKDEIEKASATQPRRLSKYQYPFIIYCPPLVLG